MFFQHNVCSLSCLPWHFYSSLNMSTKNTNKSRVTTGCHISLPVSLSEFRIADKMHFHLLLVTCLLVNLKDQDAHSAFPKERDRPNSSGGMTTNDSPSCPPAPLPPPPGGQDAPCSVHTACFKGLICALPKDLVKGSCDKITCGADTECEGASALPARCLGGSCVAKLCYTNSDCPKGYGCFDGPGGNQCKKVLVVFMELFHLSFMHV